MHFGVTLSPSYLTTGIKDRLLPALMIVALPVGLVIFIRYSQTYISLFAVMVILSGIVGSFFTTHKIFSLSYPAFGLMYANSMTSHLVDETLILVAAPALVLFWRKSLRSRPTVNCLSCS